MTDEKRPYRVTIELSYTIPAKDFAEAKWAAEMKAAGMRATMHPNFEAETRIKNIAPL